MLAARITEEKSGTGFLKAKLAMPGLCMQYSVQLHMRLKLIFAVFQASPPKKTYLLKISFSRVKKCKMINLPEAKIVSIKSAYRGESVRCTFGFLAFLYPANYLKLSFVNVKVIP